MQEVNSLQWFFQGYLIYGKMGFMGNRLKEWLSTELQGRSWSHRELARRIGMSQAIVSKVLSGERNPGADFCVRVAQALDTPPEMVLRLAGILPSPAAQDDDATLNDIMELARNLPPDEREDLLKYAQFLYQKLNNQ